MHVAWHKSPTQIENQNKTKLGAYNHRFGMNRAMSTSHTSSFLLHTPPAALRTGMYAPSRFMHHQTPTMHYESNSISKWRLSKKRPTTTTPAITTTQFLRADQQPPIDEDGQDDIDGFVSLRQPVSIQPVTVQPHYFTNEVDRTQRRISSHFIPLLQCYSCHVPLSNRIPAIKPGKRFSCTK